MAYSKTPTAKASITITTSGMTSSDTAISASMNLTDVAHALGCTKTTGLKRATGTANSGDGLLIFDTSSFGGGSACRAFLYVNNPNDTTKGNRKLNIHETNTNNSTKELNFIKNF